jgi:hypothetical protein
MGRAFAQTIKDVNLAIKDFPIGDIAADIKKNVSFTGSLMHLL